MDEKGNQKRIVLCGAPGAGKKRLLDAIAKRWGTTIPTVFATSDEMPMHISWEAHLLRGGAVSFEALHGPGFTYEDAVVELLSRPLSLIIYVLSQSDHHFQKSWHRLELSSFETYCRAAEAFGRTWSDVPWLFIKHRSWQPDSHWMTELIPADLLASAITVDSESGSGVEELSDAMDDILSRPERGCGMFGRTTSLTGQDTPEG